MPSKGNIILVKYKLDPLGALIRLKTHSQWNHCALVISKELIIESARHGIIVSPIKKYNNKIYKTKLIIPNLNENKINKIILNALYLQKKYSYFYRIFIIIIIGLKLNKLTPCITCSGFIAYCFSLVNMYFNKNKPLSHITPEDINNWEKIKNVKK